MSIEEIVAASDALHERVRALAREPAPGFGG